MTDQKPPRLAGDDRQTLVMLLQYQRDSFVRKVAGISDEDAARSPVASGTSLLWLANHLADAEVTWIVQRFAGRPDSAVAGAHADTVGAAVDRYRRVWEEVDGVVAAAPSLDAPCPPFDDAPPVNLRWIVAHLLEETARHAGHADVVRELIDGATGR